MLTVTAITKHYGDVRVLDGASLQLRAGERAALVGPNGTGKSTLLRIVAGEVEADSGLVALMPGARVAYLPQDAGVCPGRTVHDEMASVFGRLIEIETRQCELAESIDRLPSDDPELMRLVEEQAGLHAEFERLDGYTLEANIGQVLAGLGFRQVDWSRATEEFSGGWQMRIALAKLLLQAPDILLLDEPTNHLDLAATEWLEEYLLESGTAALIVSHDRYFLDRVTRRTFELRDGRVNDFAMPYSRYAAERRRLDEAKAAAFERQQEYLAKQQAYVERFRASATKSSGAKSREKMLARVERLAPPRHEQRIAFRFVPARDSGREVVQLADVVKAYGTTVVLGRVDLLVERGDRIGLVGPNGAGKSTLLRLMAGLESPDRGRVGHGHNVQLAYFSQTQAESLDAAKTVLEEIQAAAPFGATTTELRTLLGRFLFQQEDVEKKVGVLSGGERGRLALVRLLLRPANLLLLDEPTNHLDIPAREVLEAALRAYPGTAIIASHDRYLLDRVATRIVEVGNGGLRGFLGNYTSYRERRMATSADVRPAPRAPTAAAARSSPFSLGEGRGRPLSEAKGEDVPSIAPAARREKPRPERQAREAANRLAKLETEVERLERRRAELEARLADPDLWTDAAEATRVVDELSRVQAEIESATTRWDELVATT